MINRINEFCGENSLKNLKSIVKQNNTKKILIFCGKKSFVKSGAKSKLVSNLSNAKLFFFFKKYDYPNTNELRVAINYLNKIKPELIIAVGGGGVMDLAKCTNVLHDVKSINKNISNLNSLIKKKYCQIICIPTTAGSGAEATRHAVLYLNKAKYSIEHSDVHPDYFFLDPTLLLSLPKYYGASASIDAISQSIESILSIRSNKKSIDFASKSLELCSKNIGQYINNPNVTNSTKMLIGANLAGKAINISKTTAPHAISYPITSCFGISHGQSVCITLPDILEYNFNNLKYAKAKFDLKKRFKIIFNILKVENTIQLNYKIKKIIQGIGLTNNIKDLGISSVEHINSILKLINLQRLNNNPVSLDKNIVYRILMEKLDKN